MQLDPIAKVLVLIGIVLILVGVAWHFGWIQSLRLGRLPGDIRIEKENFKFYFPLTTCLLISAVIGLISWLFKR
ncbi:DUF2905 domain-containing protein [Bdellovibrio sp. 22V]|uniref:DUF2905 domain-containing protein n=1 Tax=Bdellovibrio sp. 22V TaxID=3044166 RepID=UPI002542DE54|nr:DUF2905 domain-containing protein [Bdellovibrio sp. 22V]WII72621.1 DUF2905 domain-containing protein [Bdellovibrio sp. 22V]